MKNNIAVSESFNYIGAFLTFKCGLNCSYCINNFNGAGLKAEILKPSVWINFFNKLKLKEDLPLTLQGGEPTLYSGFYEIINGVKKEINIDILTNLEFDVYEFMEKVRPERIKRNAPYASIRVSYHPEKVDMDKLIKKTVVLKGNGYSIGIWAVDHPAYKTDILNAKRKAAEQNIDFRLKEFLGYYKGKLYGSYKYTGAVGAKFLKKCLCRTTELLIAPDGNVYKCHHDLYNSMEPTGNITDRNFAANCKWRECTYYGACNPCDVKIKTNRFQQFGHTSVEIKLKEE